MKLQLGLLMSLTLLLSGFAYGSNQIIIRNDCFLPVNVFVKYDDKYNSWEKDYKYLQPGMTFYVGETNRSYYFWNAHTSGGEKAIKWDGNHIDYDSNGNKVFYRKNQIEESILPIRCSEDQNRDDQGSSGRPTRLESDHGNTRVYGDIIAACSSPQVFEYSTKVGSETFRGHLRTKSGDCSLDGVNIRGSFKDNSTSSEFNGCSGLFYLKAYSTESAYYKLGFKVTGPADQNSYCASIGKEFEIDLAVYQY
jgi:hypothetical protein